MIIRLKELSDSYMSRMRGVEVSWKIIEISKNKQIKNKQSNRLVRIVLDEVSMVSFSFLDEIVKRMSQFFSKGKNKLVFVTRAGKKSSVYKKLGKISALRKVDIYFSSNESGRIHKVPPQFPANLPNFEFEEKPITEE